MGIFSGIGTFVIAGIVAYIAWQQHKTSRDTLRLQLFEKRYEIYATLMNFMSRIVADAEPSVEDIMLLKAKTSDARFLFDDDVCQHITDAFEKAWDIRRAQRKLSGPAPTTDEQRDALIDEEAKLLGWFNKQVQQTQEKFDPYLKFDTKLKVSNKTPQVTKD
jgi:hypothetical protein